MGPNYILNSQISWAVRVSPVTTNRIVDAARSILNRFLPDIYIYTDTFKGSQSGKYVLGFCLAWISSSFVLICIFTLVLMPHFSFWALASVIYFLMIYKNKTNNDI